MAHDDKTGVHSKGNGAPGQMAVQKSEQEQGRSSVGPAANQSIQRLQDAANQSPQVQQLKALQRSATSEAAPIQAKLSAEALDGLSEEDEHAAKALDQLKEMAEMMGGSISPDMLAMVGDNARASLAQIKASVHKDRFTELIAWAEAILPAPKEEVGISKISHSMWVEGDYAGNEEVQTGMSSRKGGAIDGWKQIMWVYRREADEEAGLKEIPVQVGGVDMVQKDFRAYLAQDAVREAYPWLIDFIPILDILLEKKGYVAMGDLMRMIVLYLDGGLYTDVKAIVHQPDGDFFKDPKANKGGLHLAPGKENWALVAERGSEMIETLLKEALGRLPSLEKLAEMPVNYKDGQYSQAHKELHEDRSVFTSIDKRRGKAGAFGEIDESIGLENPRPVNSWAHTDGVKFNWDEE